MEPMNVEELLRCTGGSLLGDLRDPALRVQSVERDSRLIRPGGLFVALIGERFDGHDFLDKALENGAAGCLVMKQPAHFLPGKFYIQVENTQLALGALAKHYRSRFSVPYIAVTGSVGKTTTKEMISSVLKTKYKVLKTEGSYNNEIGLPLTLFRQEREHEICVLEMGMNHFEEIDYLTRIVEPDLAVITNIGDAHIENLGSYENILKAKCEIFRGMTQEGLAILNGDDPLLRNLSGKLLQTAICYGVEDEKLPYHAADVENLAQRGVRCTIQTPKQRIAVEIPAPGRHMIYAALAATVIGEHYGLSGEEIARGIAAFVPTKMRMNVINEGGITILDDAYNANPQSMRAALEVLSQSSGSYKVAILGDMFELGALGKTLHYGVGECAARNGIDCLIAVGELSRSIYEAAKLSAIPKVHHFMTKEEAKTMLPELMKPGAVILVKASRGMEFEDLVRELQRVAPRA